MPRMSIKMNKDGTPAKAVKQGEKSTAIEVQVTYDSKVNIKGHEKDVFLTALGLKKLHGTEKAQGVGNIPAKGYIHCGDDTLYLVSRLDTAKHTIQIDKQGKVSSGVHKFG
ncbi:MAG TPA: hypothetical protein VFA50_09210 [Stellaceae bacterium]|nr:hypothetical protein [Stellaceae bacterium]